MPASSSTALGGIADLSLERRCAFVLTARGAELDATMRWLHRTAPDVQKAMSPERLAWAVAFNVGQRATASAPVSKGKRSYLDYWRPDTSWSHVWSALTSDGKSDGGDG